MKNCSECQEIYASMTEILNANLVETEDKKFQVEGEWLLRPKPGIYFDTHSAFFANLQSAPFVKIETLNIDDKECYVIKYRNEDRIIDKGTGIMIKSIH